MNRRVDSDAVLKHHNTKSPSAIDVSAKTCQRRIAKPDAISVRCESKSDCRDGYRCVKDFGPHGFCDDDGSVTPTAE